MADISITKYKTKITKPTASPSNPGYPTSDPIDPVNPPASGAGGGGVNTFLQLTDTPASYTGQAGLFPKVNSGETGLEFASAIGGTIASGQVAFGTGTGTIGGDSGFVWDNINKRLGVGRTPLDKFEVVNGSSRFGFNSLFNQYLKLGGSSMNDASDRAHFWYDGATATIRFNSQSNSIAFAFGTNLGSERWRIEGNGNMNAVGSQTFGTTTGNLIIRTNGGNGNILINPNGSGNVGINSDATEKLDVNGTVRIRTLSNATGDFVTASATGVLQKRTAAEVVSDLGITGSNWTVIGSDIYRNSAVAIGRTTIPTNNTFSVQSTKTGSSDKFFLILNNAGTERYSLQQGGTHTWYGATANFNLNTKISASGLANRGSSSFDITETGGGTRAAFQIKNSLGVLGCTIMSNGNYYFETANTGIVWTAGGNIVVDTTNGLKIGTATTQKLAFWNATPIVQPTTAVTGATLVGGGGTTITDTDTFDGYTLAQVVKALRNIGLLA